MNIIPLSMHPLARQRAAATCAARVADRFGLDAPTRARLITDTTALMRAGCSAAWALRIARRTARRAAHQPGVA